MNIKIEKSLLKGSVRAPASKSMAHRLLICAGLCEGESRIDNISYSQDILATIDCLETMGAEIKREKDSVRVKGISPETINESKSFSARESGSTLRFFIPLALLSSCEHSFSGYGRLMERPMEIYEKISEEKGLLFENREGKIFLRGKLTSGEYTLRGDVSSQFISGLLFALVLCEGDSRIRLTGKIESRSYIDMTIDALGKFGVRVIWEREDTLYIKGSQKYCCRNLTVEGDYSNAAFPDAFNYTGCEIEVTGLSDSSIQGDRVYREYFKRLAEGRPTLDVSDCPDLAPVLIALSSMLNGAVLTGTARLKIKESDRGQAMKEELSKFGADITLKDNEIIINKAQLHKSSSVLSGHNDHRIVMALSILCSYYGGEIEGAEAIEKSYPDYFEAMKSVGLEFSLTENENEVKTVDN